LEWKNDGVIDDNSGDDDTGEVRWSWSRAFLVCSSTQKCSC